MEKKYELLTENAKIMDNAFVHAGLQCAVLYQIRALKDFGDVKKGDLGGWVESEDNLSQEGNCWIYGNASVSGNAKISGNASVHSDAVIIGSAKIYGNSIINGNIIVGGRAEIYDNTQIYNNTRIYLEICNSVHIYEYAELFNAYGMICGNARIYGNVFITDDILIDDSASIFGNASISGYNVINKNARISGNINNKGTRRYIFGKDALISSEHDYITIGPIGSRLDYITFYRSSDGLAASTGCFSGTLDELTQAVEIKHGNNKLYETQYLAAIEYAEKVFNVMKEENE